MSEWKKVKLGELATKITKGTTPSNIGESFCESGIPFIRSELITQNKYISNERLLYISNETHQKLKRSQLETNDILFSMAGIYLGKTAILRDCDVPANTNQAVALIRLDPALCDIEFVYYYLNQESIIRYVNQISGQAAQPNINLQQIGAIPIEIPSKEDQHRIATILSRYDSLIENYQKQIKLLEEAAQRLYKEWFVELRFPGHENIRMVDGLPEGWERKKVGDLLEKIQRTKQVPANNYQLTGNIPIIDQSKDYIAGYTDDEECLVKVSVPFIVFGDHTRVLKFIPFSFAKGADGTQLIMSNDLDKMPQTLFYNSLVNVDLSNYSYARHFKYLKEELVVVPTKEIASSYDEVVSRAYQTIHYNRKQIRLLTEARDRLLPRLMGGEMEV